MTRAKMFKLHISVAAAGLLAACTATPPQGSGETVLQPAQAVMPAPTVLPPPPMVNAPQQLRRIRSAGRTNAPTDPVQATETANAGATQRPAPAGFVNAVMMYDYAFGAVYQVHTAPLFVTTIALRPGEKLISKAAGDTVRWILGDTLMGSPGGKQQTLVMIKPLKPDLRTNVIITTDQRVYLLDVVSHDGDGYQNVVAWNYPQEAYEALTAQAADINSHDSNTIGEGLSITDLYFDYDVRTIEGHRPAWTPSRVFDDGDKTYIEFPAGLGTVEAPPLFLINNGSADLVNYRVKGRYYEVDRLFNVAELRIGNETQTVVRITRREEVGSAPPAPLPAGTTRVYGAITGTPYDVQQDYPTASEGRNR